MKKKGLGGHFKNDRRLEHLFPYAEDCMQPVQLQSLKTALLLAA